ncbi:CAP domain-containing protein [Nocardioides xinjiangensis]|uniref:CAP domain-containing protein n=1 Tax=Nocardioides xinjiangensis TaxID=2817376 RepID=UPI001B312FF7|nr:CAP domain-containing protein [Nocardioides sp. SYSU D00514]
MQHPRLITRLAIAVTAAVLCGVPGTAGAHADSPKLDSRAAKVASKTWPVPRTVSAKDLEEASSNDLEDALMVQINEARAAHGLRKIWSFDGCTDQLAEQWGERIARTGRFEHRDQGEVIRRCDNAWAGETLVRGTGLRPTDMVELWLDSPGHREILLSPRARRAGVAITRDAQGRTIGVVNLVKHS